jgi:hypothetical protein
VTEGDEIDYRASVAAMAAEVLRQCKEEGADRADAIHAEADGSCWAIYTWRALRVLQFSRNDDAAIEECGPDIFRHCGSMAELYSRAAYFALRADIAEECERWAEE